MIFSQNKRCEWERIGTRVRFQNFRIDKDHRSPKTRCFRLKMRIFIKIQTFSIRIWHSHAIKILFDVHSIAFSFCLIKLMVLEGKISNGHRQQEIRRLAVCTDNRKKIRRRHMTRPYAWTCPYTGDSNRRVDKHRKNIDYIRKNLKNS